MNCGRALSLASDLRQSYPVPLASEFLNRRNRHALRFIRDRFPIRPAGRADAPAQLGKLSSRSAEMKWTNCGRISSRLL